MNNTDKSELEKQVLQIVHIKGGEDSKLCEKRVDDVLALITQQCNEKVIKELELAARLNEQKELDPVINPHQPARMRAWFKDRIAIYQAQAKETETK